MRIIVSQQKKQIKITFQQNKLTDVFVVSKSDEFLGCIDKLVRKNKMKLETLRNAHLEFQNTGLLTERIIRAIILGLSINKFE